MLVKTWEVIKAIRQIDDERATKLLEDIFMSGYVSGAEEVIAIWECKYVSPDLETSGKASFIKRHG